MGPITASGPQGPAHTVVLAVSQLELGSADGRADWRLARSLVADLQRSVDDSSNGLGFECHVFGDPLTSPPPRGTPPSSLSPSQISPSASCSLADRRQDVGRVHPRRRCGHDPCRGSEARGRHRLHNLRRPTRLSRVRRPGPRRPRHCVRATTRGLDARPQADPLLEGWLRCGAVIGSWSGVQAASRCTCLVGLIGRPSIPSAYALLCSWQNSSGLLWVRMCGAATSAVWWPERRDDRCVSVDR